MRASSSPLSVLFSASLRLCGCLLLAASAGCEKQPAGPAFICTGQTLGYLEPCGCTRPQLGGFPRRDSFVAAIKPLPILVDNGDQVEGIGRQSHIKWQTIAGALGMLGYRAVNVGEKDLALGGDFIRQEAAAASVPLISANIADGAGKLLFEPFVVVELRSGETKVRIGIVGLIAPDLAKDLPVTVLDPAEALDRIVAKLEAGCDWTVLLAHMPYAQAEPLARRLPGNLFTVCAHQSDESDVHEAAGCLMVSPGQKSRAAIVCRVVPRGDRLAVKATEHDLGPKLADAQRMVDLLSLYQEMLKQEKLLAKLPREEHPGGEFAGSASCAPCHRAATDVWRKSRHPGAYQTLVKKNRDSDPECAVCHTVGLKYNSGFASAEATPGMGHVGCESCHGPGKAHNDDPGGVKIPKGDEAACRKCHDIDNDPKFEFKTYWPKIRHGK